MELVNKNSSKYLKKTNDENASRDLIDLKSEVCNILEGKILLKVGTKNKMILILNSLQDIIKKRKYQLAIQAKLNRLNKYRSTSPSLNTCSNDSEMNKEKYAKSIEESIGKILKNLNNHIRDHTYVDISANDFGITFGDITDQFLPYCSVQCICGNRMKLFFNHNQFQLSNLIKHLRNDNNRSKILMKNASQESYDQKDVDDIDQMDVGQESSRDENNLSTIQNIMNKQINNNADDTDDTAVVTIKKVVSI